MYASQPRIKKKQQHSIVSKVVFGVLVVIVILLLKGVWGIFIKERQTRLALEEAQERFNGLDVRAEFLENEVADLQTDDGIEAEIRETFGLGREGEHVIVVTDSMADDVDVVIEKESFWSRFVNIFGN